MISTVRLTQGLVDDWVVFDKSGVVLEQPIPPGAGPATILVTAVTDALKTVDESGVVHASIDRDRVWAVAAIALHGSVLEALGERQLSMEEIIEAVPVVGHHWHISPISAP